MEISRVYSEVYEILNVLGSDYIKKLPSNLYEHIMSKRDKKCVIEYDINVPIEEQNFCNETLDLIAYLNLHYWCDEKEKIELLKIYMKNEKRNEG